MIYLGIDLGTSELKASMLADDHHIVGTARAALTVQRPQPLWSEQTPADWWTALEQALRATHPAQLSAVRAIGLSGQLHGAMLLDENDAMLRPATR